MSGGSWQYVYNEVNEAADRLLESKDLLRRAFGTHLKQVAEALHDMEWVDSGDYSPGDETGAINKVLNPIVKPLLIEEIEKDLQRLTEEVRKLKEV